MAIDKIKLNSLGTTGTASSSNFLRGDMAWTAIAGDIEGVTAGTGLNGGGTSGTVTLNVDAAQTTITSLASNVVISTSGAITTTGAFTSIGIDDNADAVAITIDSSEKVGIGTTSPDTILHAEGATETTITAKSTTSSSYSRLFLGTDNADDAAYLISYGSTHGNANKLAIKNGYGSIFFAPGASGTATEKLSLAADGTLLMSDNVLQRPEIKDYSETKTALSPAATVDISMAVGNVFTVTADQNTTFTFSNPSPTGKSCSFTLIWTQDSSDRTITWPGTVDWAGGSAPDVTSGSGKIDVYTFFTLDAGTIWYGFQAGADLS